jgi:hypothetical protein
MFNLLPKADKDAIRHEYRLRLSVVALWFLFVSFIAASLLILPAYTLSTQKEKTAFQQSETLSKSVEIAQAERFEDVLADVQHKLAAAGGTSSRTLFELIGKLADLRNDDVAFNTITIMNAPDGMRRLNISGQAATRGALVAFEKALRESRLFETVELPVSNLAKESNTEFSLSAAGPF